MSTGEQTAKIRYSNKLKDKKLKATREIFEFEPL